MGALSLDVGYGADTITGFENDIDTIQISSALAAGRSVAEILADSSITTETYSSVVIDFGDGDSLRITNAQRTDLLDDISIT